MTSTALGGTSRNWAEAYEKARQLVSQMTLLEKVNVTTGTGWQMGPCVGNTGPVPRLGFPSLCLQDGPQGPRFADFVTAFPSAITAGGEAIRPQRDEMVELTEYRNLGSRADQKTR